MLYEAHVSESLV